MMASLKMKKLLVLFSAAAVLQITSSTNSLGDPLILTPFIEENQIQEARDAAEVHLEAFQNVTSYSGYFTVDKEYNGNLFFWFFPSENNYAEDPVLLWLEGSGPGFSSLFGLFTQNGPFTVEKNHVSLRDYSWHKNYSVLYIDQPVRTGYSFTESPYYITNQTEVGDHLYSALTQFFTVFSELQSNPFFVSGESYGGKFVPAIGYTIFQRNPTASLKINLQGLIIGNGLSDPIHQHKYGDLLYQLGLIDLPTVNAFKDMEKEIDSNIKLENYAGATYYWYEMLDELFFAKTSLHNINNFLKDLDDTPNAWERLIVQKEIRQAIHVGSQTFNAKNSKVYSSFYNDFTRSVAPWISELLSNYRVLIFNGQLDIMVGYVLTTNYLQNLNFSAAEEYKTASRDIWTVGNRIAGYVKTAGNLTEVLVRNAGKMVAADQPEVAYDLISKFINNVPLTGK